jgi:lysophospholipase L1-like esterase
MAEQLFTSAAHGGSRGTMINFFKLSARVRPTGLTASMAGAIMLAAGAAAASSASAQTPFTTYYAFGDSYASGVGSTGTLVPPCDSSASAWPVRVHSALRIPNLAHEACSGATTQDILTNGGRLNMEPQIRWLPVPEQVPALVTIQVGGNDFKLDARLRQCFEGSSSSSGPSSTACLDLTQMLDTGLTVVNQTLTASLQNTFSSLRAAAPTSTIVAIGYPHLVDVTNPACDQSLTGFVLNREKRQKLNYLIDAINAAIKTAAYNAGINWIVDEVVAAFEGHEACSGNDWIVSGDTAAATGVWVSVGHPNDAGQEAIARLVAAPFLRNF